MAQEKATQPQSAPAPQAPKAPRPQVPSIGRVVIYTTALTARQRPAFITDLEDGITSITVFNPVGAHYMEDVPFSEEYEQGCWSWPQRV